MKHHPFKRIISSLLVFAMVLALCPTIALAGDMLPYTGESALAENEPTSHGYTAFSGSTIYNPSGAMLCVWCDKGNADGDDGGANVAEKIAPVIEAFGGTLPETRVSTPVISASHFPDAALRQVVISQVGPYVTDLAGWTGALDCSNKDVSDLTGLDLLPGLTGLNLTGTKVTKITSAMIPDTVEVLDLTNCRFNEKTCVIPLPV